MTRDNFMPELGFRQTGFTSSAYGPSTENCERIQSFKETGDLNCVYRYELDKVCCAHDFAYADSKYLVRGMFRTRLQ